MTTLAGQHAFISGGGSGIGLGAARALVADGASVTLCGRTAEKLEAAQSELGDAAAIAIADVVDESALAQALANANDRAPLTIAIANAGVGGVPAWSCPSTAAIIYGGGQTLIRCWRRLCPTCRAQAPKEAREP